MRFAEPDIYLTGTTVGGKPTCIFPPKMYHRIITSIVVGNSTASSVACYRGQLGSTPVAQNAQGSNNTLTANIRLPAGQAFFVQWSATGASVRDAFARVTFERDDNPLAGELVGGQEWDNNPITSLIVPTLAGPNDPAIVLGADIPPELVAYYAPAIVVAVLIFRQDANDYAYQALLNLAGVPFAEGIVNAGVVYEQFEMFKGTTASQMSFFGSILQLEGGALNVRLASALNVLDAGSALNIGSSSSAPDGDFNIDDRSQGRGFITSVESTANGAAIGAETVDLTLPSATYYNGRAYEARIVTHYFASAPPSTCVTRLRLGTTTAGALVWVWTLGTNSAATATRYNSGIFRRVAGSDLTTQMCMTMATTAGNTTNGGGANNLRSVQIWDIGAAADFANYPAI